jgi:hypothetical protein
MIAPSQLNIGFHGRLFRGIGYPHADLRSPPLVPEPEGHDRYEV